LSLGVKDVIDAYLFLYNAASFVAWGCVFYLALISLLNSGGDFTVVHNDVREVLAYVQTGAILEVMIGMEEGCVYYNYLEN